MGHVGIGTHEYVHDRPSNSYGKIAAFRGELAYPLDPNRPFLLLRFLERGSRSGEISKGSGSDPISGGSGELGDPEFSSDTQARL